MRYAFRLIGNHYGYLLPRKACLIKKAPHRCEASNPQKINKNKSP